MHCVLTADLAALLSQHGPAILYQRDSVPPAAIGEYWTTSRNRFDLWHQAMARYRKAEQGGDYGELRRWWRDHVVVMEEVFVTEMLTRVVATLASGLDDRHDSEELSPVTHAIFMTHLEARNRVQHIMLYGKGNSVQDVVRLNRLRQGVERWSDALIGQMCAHSPKDSEYAIDQSRAAEFAEETRAYGKGAARDTAQWLMNAAMHETLKRRTSDHAALPQANKAVAKSVLLMLRPELFDSVGSLKSLWLHRLQSGTDRADRVVRELRGNDIDEADTANAVDMVNEPYFQRWYL